MQRDDPMMRIRLPVELKAWLAGTAVRNRRSQNAEVVHRLEAAMAAEVLSRSEGGAPTAGRAS